MIFLSQSKSSALRITLLGVKFVEIRTSNSFLDPIPNINPPTVLS